MIKITAPLNDDVIKTLKSGDNVLINGYIYTARDAAHKRMCESVEKGEELPFDLNGNIIYYAGPTPTKPGYAIGSCGPTTSGRMDKYAPRLMDLGLKGMIGKGERNKNVKDKIIEKNCVYFAAVGGAGALISKCVKECEIIAYSDLGTEAIRRLKVEDFPAVVIIDNKGNDLYER